MYRSIQRVEAALPEGVCFAFRHVPLTEIHPHALAASLAAEAAAARGRCGGYDVATLLSTLSS